MTSERTKSRRGIAWRVADSLGLRRFIGYDLTERTPEHSSLSRIRTRLDLHTHQTVFEWVLKVLTKEKLLRGKPWASMQRRSKHVRRCGPSCAATPASPTMGS